MSPIRVINKKKELRNKRLKKLQNINNAINNGYKKNDLSLEDLENYDLSSEMHSSNSDAIILEYLYKNNKFLRKIHDTISDKVTYNNNFTNLIIFNVSQKIDCAFASISKKRLTHMIDTRNFKFIFSKIIINFEKNIKIKNPDKKKVILYKILIGKTLLEKVIHQINNLIKHFSKKYISEKYVETTKPTNYKNTEMKYSENITTTKSENKNRLALQIYKNKSELPNNSYNRKIINDMDTLFSKLEL